MVNAKINKFGSVNSGRLSRGCLLCMEGKKLVVFVTGKCSNTCYYCPISEESRGKSIVKANERPVRKMGDLITEAREMRAMGAGITGGEPLLELNKVCKIIRFLKKTFGKKFHIHLYTWGSLADAKAVRSLEEAGLDEIRFHLFRDFGSKLERVLPALASKMQVTVEVPAIPTKEKEKELKELILFMKDKGSKFLNLNEFEFSDSNFERMRSLGFEQASDISYAVKGSRGLALSLAGFAGKKINVHFCPSFVKSGLQLRERLKRRAKTIMKPFERVNSDGFIEKAVVEGISPLLAKKILASFAGKRKFLFYNKEKKRIEASEAIAKRIAKNFSLKAFHLIEYPCFGAWDFEKAPLYV